MTPIGTTMNAQIAISQIVPKIADSMPARSGLTRDGKLEMNCHETTGNAIGGEVPDDRAEPDERERERRVHERGEDAGAGLVAPGAIRDDAGRDLRGGHSYTCRYLRTSLIEIRFRIRVMTNSVNPTAKIVLYSIDPVGMSPRAIEAMNDAIDW